MTYIPRKGFTLVETMVAIALLSLALIGPYVAVQNAVQSSYIARDQLVASQLAQEGIEYIRFIRDNNYLSGRAANGSYGWMHFPYSCAGASPQNYCTVDATQGDFHTQSSAVDVYSQIASVPYMKISGTGRYSHQAGGTDTKFKRIVRIYTINANEIQIWVQVQWTTGARSYSVTLTDNLQDWI
jgi:prepilin-type N-terminal cleavage/methylation domain-containing protein